MALDNLLPKKKTKVGSPSILPPQGYFGLMFLMHYLKLSDEKLLERLNIDWAMQMFCGIQLCDNQMVRDNAFVSNARIYLAKHIYLGVLQQTLIANWKQEIPDKQVVLMDATCYESYIRFPTDVKLLRNPVNGCGRNRFPCFVKLIESDCPAQSLKTKRISMCLIVNRKEKP